MTFPFLVCFSKSSPWSMIIQHRWPPWCFFHSSRRPRRWQPLRVHRMHRNSEGWMAAGASVESQSVGFVLGRTSSKVFGRKFFFVFSGFFCDWGSFQHSYTSPCMKEREACGLRNITVGCETLPSSSWKLEEKIHSDPLSPKDIIVILVMTIASWISFPTLTYHQSRNPWL